jgi:hypothetical protein
LWACGPLGDTGTNTPSDDASGHVAGCALDGRAPRVAPGGYYTNGATVCTSDGQAHLFHGVDRPSLEWSTVGDQISADDFALMAGWNANVVRIALNQDFWLSGAAQYDANYGATVAAAVQWAEAAGLDVILDLHWSDRGDLSVTKSAQQQMADANSKEFWSEVAKAYKGDGRVLFELYNEPHDIAWSVWQNGGAASGFTAVGMQELYDAVRGAGADNLVIAGGLDFAYTLSGVTANALRGFNILYATHPYNQPSKQPSGWEGSWGFLATGDIAPVIVTEFGDGSAQCTGSWDEQLIAFADAHRISWTAWAWYLGGCKFPALLADWSATPTVQGQVVKSALLGYPKSSPPAEDGGLDAASADASSDLEGSPEADSLADQVDAPGDDAGDE